MTNCLVISVNGDVIHTGPAEECTAFMRSHALADRVVRASDGVRLAVCQPWSNEFVWKIGFDHPGAPMGST